VARNGGEPRSEPAEGGTQGDLKCKNPPQSPFTKGRSSDKDPPDDLKGECAARRATKKEGCKTPVPE